MAAHSTTKSRQFSTHINLPVEARDRLIELLNQSLADCLDLFSQSKQAHWNVKGEEFYQLHLLFDELAGELAEFVDLLAERATTLGGYATGTVRMAAAHSTLPEYPTEVIDGREHLEALVDRFAHFAAHLRRAIDESAELGDQSTADLYTEVSRAVDKRLWFLEAHFQGK